MKPLYKLLLIYVALILAMVWITGCMTAKNLPRHNDKYPLQAAQYAAQKWPCTDSISVIDSTHFDTLYLQPVYVDTTIICDSPQVKVVKVACPPREVIRETKTKTTYVVRLDSAHAVAVRLALQKEQQVRSEVEGRLQTTKDKLNWWKTACLITWGLIALVIGWKARRLFGVALLFAALSGNAQRQVPIKNMLGVNAHWWDFLRGDVLHDKAIMETKYNSFLSLNLTSLRNYGNVQEYQPVMGQWAFNPVRQGWYEEELMKRLKQDRPQMVKWTVYQGQFDFIRASWNVPDPLVQLKGTITEFVDHGGWASVQVNFFEGTGSGTFARKWYFTSPSGNTSSTNWFTVPATFPKLQGFAVGGGLAYKVGDTVTVTKGQYSNLNIYYADNAHREAVSTWETMGRTAFMDAARHGTNPLVPDYSVWSHGVSWYDPNQPLKATGTHDLFEGMNEPNHWWDPYDDNITPKELAAALSMMYDGHMGQYPTCGIKNADPNYKMSTSGLATDKVDMMREVVQWSKVNRGYINGKVNLPFDYSQFHCYSSLTGQWGGSLGGIPPELGMLPQIRNYVLFSRNECDGREVWVGEWGWDVHPQSPLNAPAFGQYSAEQTRAMWAVRGILSFVEAGLDRAQWYRLYQDYNKWDATPNQSSDNNPTQFSTMALLRQQDNAASVITRTLVGDYFKQVSEFGDYVFDSRLDSAVNVLRFKNEQKKVVVAIWAVETMNVVNNKPSFSEKTGVYNLTVPANSILKIRRFADDGSGMMTSQMVSASGSYPVTYSAKPVLIEVEKAVALPIEEAPRPGQPPVIHKRYTVTVTDIIGRKLKTYRETELQKVRDDLRASRLLPGIYLIKYSSDKEAGVEKYPKLN